jgi:hypothetical protein
MLSGTKVFSVKMDVMKIGLKVNDIIADYMCLSLSVGY